MGRKATRTEEDKKLYNKEYYQKYKELHNGFVFMPYGHALYKLFDNLNWSARYEYKGIVASICLDDKSK